MCQSNFYLSHLLSSVIFLSIWVGPKLHAQSIQPFNLETHQLGDSQGVSVRGVSGQLAHRLFLDKEGSGLLTLGLQVSQVNLTDASFQGVDQKRELRTLVPSATFLKALSPRYSLILNLRPGFFGSLSGNLSSEFRLEGGAVVTRFINENLTLGLGLARGTNFGQDLIVPLFQFLYFAGDQIVLRGLLPARASVWYIPSQKWEFGLLFKLQGSLYKLEETTVVGAQRLGLADAQLGVSGGYKLFGTHFIKAEVGYSLVRRYLWDDKLSPSFVGSVEPFSDKALNSVPYFKLGLVQKF